MCLANCTENFGVDPLSHYYSKWAADLKNNILMGINYKLFFGSNFIKNFEWVTCGVNVMDEHVASKGPCI